MIGSEIRFEGNVRRILQDVTLDQLCIFIAAGQSTSFSDAARKCGKTQSAISKSITNLELDLGVDLFDRTGHGVSPTPIGRELLPLALGIVNRVRGLCGRAEALREGRDSVQLFVDGLFPLEKLNALVAAFAQQYPNYGLIAKQETPLEVLRRWQIEPHSIIISSRPLELGGNARISSLPLGSSRFVPVARADHPLAGQGVIAEAALTAHRQVKFYMGRRSGRMPDVSSVIYMDSLYSQLNLILDGLGWGYVPDTLVERQIRDGSLKILDLNGRGVGRELTFRLGWRQEDSERGASRALVELCGNSVETAGAPG